MNGARRTECPDSIPGRGGGTEFHASGVLVRVLDDRCPPFPGYFLYYPTGRQQPAALAAPIATLRVWAGRRGISGASPAANERDWLASADTVLVATVAMRGMGRSPLVSAHRGKIVQRFGVRSLSLFGSVARDEARPDSNVDVLVEFEGPTTFDGHIGLLIFLEDLLGRRVDVLTDKGIKSRLRPLIDQDLVRVA